MENRMKQVNQKNNTTAKIIAGVLAGLMIFAAVASAIALIFA
jgi:hypothetical protein